LEPLVDAAQKIESALHRNDKEKKSANWLLKAAKDADLALDENLTAQITETLGHAKVSKRKATSTAVIAPIDMIDDQEGQRRRELTQVQKYKQRYEELKKTE
jgi:hypothetical protein